jgi:amidophosphoribosyltransferase
MGILKEHCGVFGAYSHSGANVTPIIIKGLEALQNRGQESFGISVGDNPVYKKAGLVYYGYREDKAKIDGIMGPSGIGHVRYSTVGSSGDDKNFHPIQIESPTRIRIAHNGTISNTSEMRALLREDGIEVREDATDTELAGHLLSKFFAEKGDWVSAFNRFESVKNGSYCFVIQTPDGEIIAARDSSGYRPLCYGRHDETDSFIVASESFALDKVGATKLGDIRPGELVIVGEKGEEFHRFAEEEKRALCVFEFTYFAHPASNIDGVPVATARQKIGRELYRKFGLRGDVVVPVPESALHAAEGYSQESGIPLVHAMGKDRYSRRSVLRGFIQPYEREAIAESMFVIPALVDGKHVVVIDDSIVRGTSSSAFIKALQDAGAKSISLLSTFPPIRSPCFMGIDFPTSDELIAHRVAARDELDAVGAKVAKALGIEFVGYMDPLSLSRAIGLPVNSLCFSCVDGDYSKLNSVPQIRSRAEIKGEEPITVLDEQ